MNKIISLLKRDIKNVTRDFMLLISLVAPLLFALVVKFGVPLATEILARELNFNLTPHYRFIASFMLIQIPLMLGMLVGFILLEERDENILVYFSITPLTKAGYLLYRILIPVVASVIFSYFAIEFVGLIKVSWLRILPAAIMAGLEAPLMALFLAAVANNKVEGFALAKGSGILFISPIVGYLVDSPWQLIAGISPPYWVAKVVLASYDLADYWWYVGGGFIVHLGLLWILLQKFRKRAE